MKQYFPLLTFSALMLFGMAQAWAADDASTPSTTAVQPSTSNTFIMPTNPDGSPITQKPKAHPSNINPLHFTHGHQPVDPNATKPALPPTQTLIQVQQQWIKDHKDDKYKTPLPDYTHEKVETRACTKSDIVSGMWAMVYFHEYPPANADRLNHKIPYQYLTLTPGNGYARIKSAILISDSRKAQQLMRVNTTGPAAQTYVLQEKDNTSEIVFLSGKTPIIRDSCAIVKKPASVFKPGDMILNGYTKGGKTLLYELYRRWF